MLQPGPALADGGEDHLRSGGIGDVGRGQLHHQQATLGVDGDVALAADHFLAGVIAALLRQAVALISSVEDHHWLYHVGHTLRFKRSFGSMGIIIPAPLWGPLRSTVQTYSCAESTLCGCPVNPQ